MTGKRMNRVMHLKCGNLNLQETQTPSKIWTTNIFKIMSVKFYEMNEIHSKHDVKVNFIYLSMVWLAWSLDDSLFLCKILNYTLPTLIGGEASHQPPLAWRGFRATFRQWQQLVAMELSSGQSRPLTSKFL